MQKTKLQHLQQTATHSAQESNVALTYTQTHTYAYTQYINSGSGHNAQQQRTSLGCCLVPLLNQQCHVGAPFLKELHHVQQGSVTGNPGKGPQGHVAHTQVP